MDPTSPPSIEVKGGSTVSDLPPAIDHTEIYNRNVLRGLFKQAQTAVESSTLLK
jgi:hypothetical protein